MRNQKLDEPSGVKTEHWINIQVYLTSYSQDDKDPLGDDFDTILELLISAGKIKKHHTKQPIHHSRRSTPVPPVKKSKEPCVDPATNVKLPPPAILLQDSMLNSLLYMNCQLQQWFMRRCNIKRC
jgi:hypothetical protein